MKFPIVKYPPSSVSPSGDAEDKLRRFGRLQMGWSFGRGLPFPNETIETAVTLLSVGITSGLQRHEVFPGLSGEIRIAFYQGEASCDVTVKPDCSVDVEAEGAKGQEIFDRSDLSVDEAQSAIRLFASTSLWSGVDTPWNTLTSLTPYTTALRSVDLLILDLSRPLETTRSRSLTWNVLKDNLVGSVNTLFLGLNTGISYRTVANPLIGSYQFNSYFWKAQHSGATGGRNRATG